VNVIVEDIAVCRKALTIEIPSAEIDVVRNDVTTEFVQYVAIPGFRPGKAPRSVVERRYEKQIEEEVERKLVPESYRKALEEKNIRPVMITDIDKIEIKKGQPVAFKVTIDVAPEFDLPEYKGLTVTKASAEPNEEEINKTLENLREQQAEYKDVEGRGVQAGDFVIVSYTGTIDGQSIKELAPASYLFAENNDMWMRVEEDFFLKGFTTQLIGANTAEKKQVTATFKEDFPQKELAEKTALYDVEIKGIKERQLPELNDEFVKKIVPDKTLEELKDLIKKDMQKQKEYQIESQIKDQVVKQLLEKTKLELPESVLEEEKRRTIYDIVQNNQQRGVTDDILEGKKDEILTNATQNATDKLKASFILLKIAEQEKIKPTEQEVSSYLQIMADRYRMPVDKLVRKLRENMRLQEVYDNIAVGKTLDFLVQNANVQASA